MVYAAKRGKSRCLTHPGALLRDEIIPAPGRKRLEADVPAVTISLNFDGIRADGGFMSRKTVLPGGLSTQD